MHTKGESGRRKKSNTQTKVTRAWRKETLTDVLNKTEEKLALSQPVNFGSLEQNHTIIASSPSNVTCIKVACVSMHFLLLLLLL